MLETNVFFLVEIVRSLAERAGALDEVAGISAAALPAHLLTGGMRSLAERRVDSVPTPLRDALELAATLGRQLDLAVLERARPGVDWTAWLLRCTGAAVIERQAGEWRFAHDKLRDAILLRLPEARRTALHAEAAAALESLYHAVPTQAAQIAYHFARAQAWERAHHYFLAAGTSALCAASVAEARDHFQRAYDALAQLPEPARCTDEIRRRQIDTLLRQVHTTLLSEPSERNLRRMAEAQALVEALPGGADPAGPSRADRVRGAEVQKLMGQVHYFGGQMAQAIACYRRVLPLAWELGDADLLALPARLIGTALCSQGFPARAVPLLELGITALERIGDEAEWVHAMAFCGTSHIALGQVGKGRRCIEQALQRARSLGRPALLAMVLLSQACGELFTAHFAGMLAPTREALELAAPVDDKLHMHIAWGYLSIAQSFLGEHAAAVQSRARSRELAQELGEQRLFLEWFEAADAQFAAMAGRKDEALTHARSVVEQTRVAGYPFPWGVAERAWGVALGVLAPGAPVPVDAADTIAAVDEHMRLSIAAFDRGGYVLEIAQTRLRWAVVLRRWGQEERARALLDESIATYESCDCAAAIASARKDFEQAARATPQLVRGVAPSD